MIEITKDEFKLIRSFCPGFQRANINSNKFIIDWNTLMVPIKKIDELYSENFPPGEEFVRRILERKKPFDDEYMDVLALGLSTPINEACRAVINFINWHNQKSK